MDFIPGLINRDILQAEVRGHVDDLNLLQKLPAHKSRTGSLRRCGKNNIDLLCQLQNFLLHLLGIIIN